METCPVCNKKNVSFVNKSVPFLWLDSYGNGFNSCRAKLTCGHYVNVTSSVQYIIEESYDQKSECDWGN